MKSIVTGGAGFIGSHLCQQLLCGGHEVIAVDNLACGRMKNLREFEADSKLTFHKVDIRDVNKLRSCLQGVDWVFHLAALADIVPSIENPGLYFQTNTHGTLNVLECAREAGVKRFIYAASSSCYGLPDTFPTPETSPISSQYPYALSKYLGEELVLHWGVTYKIPVVSLRLFNVYGPRSRTTGTYGAVFGVFLAQKINQKPFTVVGNGTQTRDFTYVTDVTEAFIRAAESDILGEIMNVGSGNHYSVNRLVELLEGEVTFIPKRPGEPDCTFADVRKIKRLLGWEAKVSFEEGVQHMLCRLEDWRNAPVWDVKSIEKATETWFDCLGEKSTNV